jgi:hypothetical protein
MSLQEGSVTPKDMKQQGIIYVERFDDGYPESVAVSDCPSWRLDDPINLAAAPVNRAYDRKQFSSPWAQRWPAQLSSDFPFGSLANLAKDCQPAAGTVILI